MINKEVVLQIIGECIDELNDINDMCVPKNPDTVLVGRDSDLDSIDFVTIIVSIETKMFEKFDISVSITSEKAMSRTNSPFRTIDTLADFIVELIK